MPPEYLTVAQVADRLGISTQRVHQLIADGRLPSTRFGRAHQIRTADLDRPEVQERVRGRPRKDRGITSGNK
jgi:excisionase family DNA binding protein